MGNLNAVAQGDLALASVDGTAVPAAFSMNRGFAAITDNGAGDYTLELSNAQALATQGVVSLGINGATPLIHACEVVDETHLRVRLADNAGAATDGKFWIRVTPVAPQ